MVAGLIYEPWRVWASSTTTASTTSANVWLYWNDGTAGAANDLWATWVDTGTTASTTATSYPLAWTQWQTAVEETKKQRRDRLAREAQQRADWERRRAEQEVRDAELRAEQAAAVTKAEVLLREHLAEPQRNEYDRLKAFLVKAQSGRTYRIKKGWSGNVELLNDDGEPIMRFCIHPAEQCPDQDNMLAQKFLLETDEEAFNRIANKTVLHHPVAA